MLLSTQQANPLSRAGLVPAPNVPNPRNAGRKKSNPVWEFFTDLRSNGLAGVRCRFCHWVTNDRSPTTMKFHLKRKHDTGPGGLWAICEEKINSQAPANYAPRTKKTIQPDDLLFKAFTQNQFNFNPFTAMPEMKLAMPPFQDDFLSNLIQQATQYAHGSTSPSSNTTGIESETLSLSDTVFLEKLNASTTTETKEEDSSSSSVSGIVPTSEFQLTDGSSVTTLLKIASDSELVFTFDSRKVGEYCFESPKKDGKMVTLCDYGNEIKVVQKIFDKEILVEMWRKSDWQQFTWAVRGTCLHFLKYSDDENTPEKKY